MKLTVKFYSSSKSWKRYKQIEFASSFIPFSYSVNFAFIFLSFLAFLCLIYYFTNSLLFLRFLPFFSSSFHLSSFPLPLMTLSSYHPCLLLPFSSHHPLTTTLLSFFLLFTISSFPFPLTFFHPFLSSTFHLLSLCFPILWSFFSLFDG